MEKIGKIRNDRLNSANSHFFQLNIWFHSTGRYQNKIIFKIKIICHCRTVRNVSFPLKRPNYVIPNNNPYPRFPSQLIPDMLFHIPLFPVSCSCCVHSDRHHAEDSVD